MADRTDPTDPTVLVTGATGNTGSRLLPLLVAHGARIRAAARRPDQGHGRTRPYGSTGATRPPTPRRWTG
ncbi:hypothetical protein SAZ11_06825 [Streptomyces sp. FXJ1.4098]|nr:hypothetical protein [Streptomyces sp. FXJ1.4098]